MNSWVRTSRWQAVVEEAASFYLGPERSVALTGGDGDRARSCVHGATQTVYCQTGSINTA